jgi:hypothetical protein
VFSLVVVWSYFYCCVLVFCFDSSGLDWLGPLTGVGSCMCWVGGLQRGCVAKAAFSFSWEQKEYYSTIIFPMGQNMSKVSLTGEVAPSYSKMFSKRTLELIVDRSVSSASCHQQRSFQAQHEQQQGS